MKARAFHRVTRRAQDQALRDLDGGSDRGAAERILNAGYALRRDAVAALIAAPFASLYPSRWSDGGFGVLYAACELETSLVEHGFHLARVLREIGKPRGFHPRSHIVFDVSARLDDVRAEDPRYSDPDDYAFARTRGQELHLGGSNGVVYSSARCRGGVCGGIFRPDVVERPAIAAGVGYAWDGEHLEAFAQPVSPIVL